MINSTAEGNQLLYKSQPVEFLLQCAALWIFSKHFQTTIDPAATDMFISIVLAFNVLKILYVFTHRFIFAPSIDGHSLASTQAILLINIGLGLSWGAGMTYLAHTTPAFSLSDPMVIILVTEVLLAGIIGSALWSWLFTCFAFGLLSPPIYFMFESNDLSSIGQWLGLLLGTMALFTITIKLETIFNRYRQLGRQNTSLLQELAMAKEHAQRNHYEIEQSHESLKIEIQERKRVEEKIRASEKETSRILQDMQDTYFRVNKSGELGRLSPSVQFLLGTSANVLINRPFSSIFNNNRSYDDFVRSLDRHAGLIQNYETRMNHTLGHTIWVSINAHYSSNNPSGESGFEGTIRDITESKDTADTIFQEKNRLLVTLESIGDGVISTDINGIVTYINPIAETMSGWKLANAEHKQLSHVLKLVDEENHRDVMLPLAHWITNGLRGQITHPVILISKSNKSEFTIEVTGSPIRDLYNKTIGYVLVFRNMTKQRALTKQLKFQATHDSLTGLINRAEFETRVKVSIEKAHTNNTKHALCYIDLDQFKIVNDTCGHHAGDALLKQVTTTLQQLIRPTDTLARLGGDEFGILLNDFPLVMAKQIAENVRIAVEKYRFSWDNRIFRIGASIGLVPITKDTVNLEELLSTADAACYVAKEGGRNRVHVPGKDDAAIELQQGQMNMMQRIQRALDEDLFELHYQTILPIKSPITTGRCAEVLVRMIDDTNGNRQTLIPPGAFISTAERYHLMPQIDQWVIRNTLEHLSLNPSEYDDWDMCTINISGQTLSEKDKLDWVLKLLETSGVPASLICFEITESAAVENLDNAIQFITKLRTLGCRFALDDFGSGLSSFGYLKKLPVNFIKLDGELVKDAKISKAGYAVIESINNIAHVMNLYTIAEHVESMSIMDVLKKIGVDYAQGYAIDRPSKFYTHPSRRKAS